MRDEPLVCHCLAVSEAEITQAIRSGADSVEGVGQYCEAGTACQSCHGPIRTLLRAEASRALAQSRAPKTLRQLSLFDAIVDESGGRRRKASPRGGHKKPG